MANLIFPTGFDEKTTIAQDDYILMADSEDNNRIKKAKYSFLKGEKGDPGQNGQDGKNGVDGKDGTDGASIVSGAFVGDDLVFTKDNSQTVTIVDAKTTLQGPEGEEGPEGQEGPAGKDGTDGQDGNGIASITSSKSGKITTVTITETNGDVETFTVSDGEDGQGAGDVVGPASATNGNLAVFDGATGKLIKDGGAIPTGFNPGAGTTGQVLKKTNDGYGWANESGAVTSVNGQTGAVTVTEFEPDNAGSTDQVLTKTADGYKWANAAGSDYSWVTKTISGGEVELGLRTIVDTPESDFTLTAPATLKDGEEYAIRIISETSYTMTLGTGFTNPWNVDTTLSGNATDQYVFLSIGGELELQPLVDTGA